MIADLDQPMFKDDDAARAYLEAVHWPNGPVCPHCGERERVTRLQGQKHRPGVVQMLWGDRRGGSTIVAGSNDGAPPCRGRTIRTGLSSPSSRGARSSRWSS